MVIESRNTLYKWFSKGVKPLGSQFRTWIDSFWHKNENIPAANIDGLQESLDGKVDNDALPALQAKMREELGRDIDDLAKDLNDVRGEVVANRGAETIIVDEIKEAIFTEREDDRRTEVFAVSLNRPKNYTILAPGILWLPLLEMMWRTKDGVTRISSKTHLEESATFDVSQVIGPDGKTVSTTLEVYTPIRPAKDRRLWVSGPKFDQKFSKLTEYNAAGEIVRESGGSTLLDETVAIRLRIELGAVGWQNFAIYVGPEVWSQYMSTKQTGFYRMGADGTYNGVGLMNAPTIIDKGRKKIASREAGSNGRYAVAEYLRPVEPYVTVNYGEVVENPLEAVTIHAAEPYPPIGVFVKMQARRTLSKRSKGERQGRGKSFQKWCLYTGRFTGNEPGGLKPFPTADEARTDRGSGYYHKLVRNGASRVRRINYVECMVAFVELKSNGAVRNPIGPGVKFFLRNREAPFHWHRSGRSWIVERA